MNILFVIFMIYFMHHSIKHTSTIVVSMFTLDGNYSAIEGASTFQVCAVLYSGTPSITGVNLKFTANPMTATGKWPFSRIPCILSIQSEHDDPTHTLLNFWVSSALLTLH